MTRRQNLHYKLSSQQKLRTDDEYVPKSAQIKLDMAVEKGTKEVEAFQAHSEKHLQFITKCQWKLKSLVIEAGDLNLVLKKKIAIRYFVELVHNISEGSLTYNNSKEIDAHLCLIDVIKFYSDHFAVHLDALKIESSRSTIKRIKLRKCPGPALLAPCHHPLRLLLLLLPMITLKTLESKTIAFSIRELPHPRQPTTHA